MSRGSLPVEPPESRTRAADDPLRSGDRADATGQLRGPARALDDRDWHELRRRAVQPTR